MRTLRRFFTALTIPNMAVQESVTVSSGCNPRYTDSVTWYTDATGNLVGLDYLWFCADPGTYCTITSNQTFTVNGFSVLIMSTDGVTTGSKNVITQEIRNGQSLCPVVALLFSSLCTSRQAKALFVTSLPPCFSASSPLCLAAARERIVHSMPSCRPNED